MKNDDRVYRSLEEQSLCILNNLNKLDKDIVEEIVKAIPESSASVHLNVYKTALTFHKENNRFPGIEYLKAQFGEAIKTIKEKNFTVDFVHGFLGDVRREILVRDLRVTTMEEDFKGIVQRIDESGILNEDKEEEDIDEAARKIYEVRKANPSGILLGVPEIDTITKGICYGNPCIVGGGPGSGKSTFAISSVYGALMNKFNCVYISTELSKQDLLFNFLSRYLYEQGYQIPADRIKKATLTRDEEKLVFEKLREWKNKAVNHECGRLRLYEGSKFAPFSSVSFRHEMQKVYDEWGELDLIVLDYIQNCVVWKPDVKQDPTQFLNWLVEYLRSFTIGFNGRGLALMILSQLNREGIKKIQRSHVGDLTCFAELNSIERCAHTAILIHADAASKLSGQTMMQIVKNRSGEVHSEMRPVNFEPAYFKVGGGSMTQVLNENALNSLSDTSIDEVMGSMFN